MTQATALVVDDEECIRKLMLTVLIRHGYTVLLASSGNEALDVFERHKNQIDYLITDIDMPGMSGLELADNVLQKSPELLIILMSGHFELAKQGCPFLPKPFKAEQLLGLIRA